jgi:hypothetical protein
MTEKIKKNIKQLGVYQIIGGAVGIILLLYSLISNNHFSGLLLLLFGVMLLFFVYSIFCGTLCVQQKPMALQHSLINQFLQLFGFAVLGFSFSYVAGIFIAVGIDLSSAIEFEFNLGISKFDMNINMETERTEVTFNLVALALIYWIDTLVKKAKAAREDEAIDALGK